MTEDRLYTADPCRCGDGWCHGCDDPQIDMDLAASRPYGYDDDGDFGPADSEQDGDRDECEPGGRYFA